MKKLHLICNAHLDPVWMWEKDEGMAETLSTFRVAADFCDDYPDFVFNHNESVLYEWIEECDPELFKRIQKLVSEDRWRIIGGFYLQPDCNLPSGEGMVRQALVGRNYFLEKFGKLPSTAINFDSFGHSRGLVQIFKKAGYESYIVCRPTDNCKLPSDEFRWVGFDGSEIVCHRGFNSYESHRGFADKKIEGYLDMYPDKELGLVLWGIGNHGGGPSRVDYELIKKLGESRSDSYEFINSYPEAFFEAQGDEIKNLPKVDKALHFQSVGCYTSQIRVKQEYRRLENLLFKAEKMASSVTLNSLAPYPAERFAEAEKDMLFTQFHDIITGSSIEPAEKAALCQLGHGIDIVTDIITKSMLFLMRGEQKAADGDIPILVYNPHPFPLDTIIEAEFNLPDQNKDREQWVFPRVYHNDQPVSCQVEHEASNFNVDWRKRVVFRAKLAPFAITRYNCKLEFWKNEPQVVQPTQSIFSFKTPELQLDINTETGALDRLTVNGKDFVKPGSLIPVIMDDDYDSWGNTRRDFTEKIADFKLLTPEEAAKWAGIKGDKLSPVNVLEDGDVRTVVEVLLGHARSVVSMRYYLPKKGTQIQLKARVFWAEKMKILKLLIATPFEQAKYLGQVMYGREELPNDRTEAVSLRWSAVNDEKSQSTLSIIDNGIYGSDYENGEVRLSLLRSPAYSAGCSDFSKRKPEVLEQGRSNVFMDQGEREFTFWLQGGDAGERLENIETDAAICNETPFAISCFPGAKSADVKPLIELSNPVVQLTAFKQRIDKTGYIIRLFEPTGKAQSCEVSLPIGSLKQQVNLDAFEIVTLSYNPKDNTLTRCALTEHIDSL